jgi:hypothetical protein
LSEIKKQKESNEHVQFALHQKNEHYETLKNFEEHYRHDTKKREMEGFEKFVVKESYSSKYKID